MPIVKNKDLEGMVVALNILLKGRPRGGNLEDREPPVKLPAMTGVILSRLRRVVYPAFDDVRTAKKAVIEAHATLNEGRVVEKPNGAAVFPNEEAETACLAEIEALGEGTIEIRETLKLSDFRRKERDPDSHQVSETDLIEADIIDGLYPLLIIEE